MKFIKTITKRRSGTSSKRSNLELKNREALSKCYENDPLPTYFSLDLKSKLQPQSQTRATTDPSSNGIPQPQLFLSSALSLSQSISSNPKPHWISLSSSASISSQTSVQRKKVSRLYKKEYELIARYVKHTMRKTVLNANPADPIFFNSGVCTEVNVADQLLGCLKWNELLNSLIETDITKITVIRACSNQLGVTGALHLVTAIKRSNKLAKSLEEITLGMNDLGDDGAQALSMVFRTTDGPTASILLPLAPLSAANSVSLQPPVASSLTILDLRWNNIGPVGMDALCQAIGSSRSCPLQELNLTRNHIGDEGLASLIRHVLLRPHSKLRSVDLSGNKITPSGVKELAEALTPLSKNYKRVVLSKSSNSSLCQSTETEESKLASSTGTIVRSSIFSPLEEERLSSSATGLVTLNLRWNVVGCDGAIALANALRTNDTLLYLDLSSTRIDFKGLRAFHDTVTLHNDTLLDLKWTGNQNNEFPTIYNWMLHEIQNCIILNNQSMKTIHSSKKESTFQSLPKLSDVGINITDNNASTPQSFTRQVHSTTNGIRRIAPEKARRQRLMRYQFLLENWVCDNYRKKSYL